MERQLLKIEGSNNIYTENCLKKSGNCQKIEGLTGSIKYICLSIIIYFNIL